MAKRGSAKRGKRSGVSRGGRRVQARKQRATRQGARGKRPLRPAHRASSVQSAPSRLRTNEVSDELNNEYEALQRRFQSLDGEAELSGVYSEIGRIEGLFTNLPAKLDELRGRGYVHSGLLEDRIDDLDQKWDEDIRPRIDKMLETAVPRLDREVDQLVNRLKPSAISATALKAMDTYVEQVETSINKAEANLRNLYSGVSEGLWEVEQKVLNAEWMVSQIEESPDLHLYEAEGPLMAVEAEWEQDGEDEGPDGVVYLTDQRLIFEQKEKVATKKFLFITTSSEMVQKLLLDVPVKDVESVQHSVEKRGMLGLRGDDILEMILAPTADHSRVRFHLKGQDSSDWAAMVKRVKSGDIDDDRADEFIDDMEAAAMATASLPEQCPSCFAPIAPQPRGVMSVTCEFCNAVIEAEVPES